MPCLALWQNIKQAHCNMHMQRGLASQWLSMALHVQAVLPVSSRFASEVSSTGFTTGAGSFVGSRLPSLGGGTYVRSGADGRGGTLKLLAPDSRPKVKVRYSPVSLLSVVLFFASLHGQIMPVHPPCLYGLCLL